ncbi:MAG: hypothetical protein V1809_14590 [Planctomycetota bacterium]
MDGLLRQTLGAARRRLFLQDFLRAGAVALAAAGMVLVAATTAARYRAIPHFAELLAGLPIAATLAAAGWCLSRPRPLAGTAHRLDTALSLDARILTAIEFAGTTHPMAPVLAEQTRMRLENVNLRKTLPLEMPREALWLAGVIFLGLVVAILPDAGTPARPAAASSGRDGPGTGASRENPISPAAATTTPLRPATATESRGVAAPADIRPVPAGMILTTGKTPDGTVAVPADEAPDATAPAGTGPSDVWNDDTIPPEYREIVKRYFSHREKMP